MKRTCIVLSSLILGWSGWCLSASAAGQSHEHAHAEHAATTAHTPPCNIPPQLTYAAEMRTGGALYTPPGGAQHAAGDHAGGEHTEHAQAEAAMEGAHAVHDPQRGGTFYMAPNKTHHIEGVYTEECGFQLFLYNAFTEAIRVDRFQALVHVYPESDDEFDIIRFLSATADGTTLQASFGGAVSRPFDIELYVRFPGSDEPQLFNIAIPAAVPAAAPAADADGEGIAVSGAWARPNFLDRPAAVYMSITNTGGADRLLSAASPAFTMIELHQSLKRGEVSLMQPVGIVDLPANATVELAPGGFHMMLFGARATFKPGDSFPLSLTFEKAGRIETEVIVSRTGAVETAQGAPAENSHASHGENGHASHGSN